MLQRLFTGLVCIVLISFDAQAGDWTQWRGPNHNNVAAAGQGVPTEWSESKNILWKADVPGRGHASPVITGNTIVLCTADDQRQTQAVIAFDRKTGKRLWLTQISSGGFPSIHPKNTHASPTAATDGTHLFAHSVITKKSKPCASICREKSSGVKMSEDFVLSCMNTATLLRQLFIRTC